jgi:LTXXQ motif family protein
MRHGRTIIVSALALILASPLYAPPAQAQDPGRVLRPLTTPFRMILRGAPRARVPRAHRSARAYRAPRARTRRQIARERSPAMTRRQEARGPAVFWPIAAPDAFEDMLGYAFWPNEYGRQFWSHGPADILRAMTAPAAAFASQDDEDGPSRRRVRTALATSTNAATDDRAICIARVKEQAVRPLDRIAETTTLMAAQRHELDALRTSVRDAIENEAAACRGDLPATQPERLRAMIDGLWAMRYAEFRIRPALETFYGSLTEEQKSQLTDAPQTVGSSDSAPADTPAGVCKEALASDTNPFDPVQRALRPTDEQRKSLQMLYGASMEMAQFLTSTCPTETPATPVARLGAASDRVMSLLHAAMGIEPMLGAFYASLSDQQRRRFNATMR